MKKSYDLGAHVHRNIPGHIFMEITDFASGEANSLDESREIVVGQPNNRGQSIKQLKERLGGKTQGIFINPYTRNSYQVDLSPWLTLDEERRLETRWRFVSDKPVSPDDPNYPKPPTGLH